jgi:hypothetical protein
MSFCNGCTALEVAFCKLQVDQLLLLQYTALQTMAALLQKYLQVQGLVGPPAITSGISIILNVAANWAGESTCQLNVDFCRIVLVKPTIVKRQIRTHCFTVDGAASGVFPSL